MKTLIKLISTRIKFSMVSIVLLLLVGCLSPWQATTKTGREWVGFSTVVDGIMMVETSLPPISQQLRTPRNQLIATQANEPVTIFTQSYNTGRGKYRGLSFIRFNGVIIRIESDNLNSNAIDFDDIKREVYLDRTAITGDYEFAGLVTYRDVEWLRVNLVGKNIRQGVSYIRPIYGHYALLVSFSMFGEHSDQTELFQERHEDLKKVLQSVQVTVENFELNRANQK